MCVGGREPDLEQARDRSSPGRTRAGLPSGRTLTRGLELLGVDADGCCTAVSFKFRTGPGLPLNPHVTPLSHPFSDLPSGAASMPCAAPHGLIGNGPPHA
jgi:hypothetical protein